MNKNNAVFVFAKAQLSAFLGGLIDYGVMIFCTEVLGVYYPISIAISGVVGAIFNFLVNRYWTFKAGKTSWTPVGDQLVRFIFVVAGSIFLKSTGTYLFTNWLKINYKFSRIIVDIIVSLGFNYLLQTYWVFRKKPI
ncbi:GtrA family protein [Pedobacter sp. JCM 36344]|uniref:GtrA family protein n=1 Tax=Pedobacter sp. JCM 36344 TaxID=3374280 RepID=UPI00397935F6